MVKPGTGTGSWIGAMKFNAKYSAANIAIKAIVWVLTFIFTFLVLPCNYFHRYVTFYIALWYKKLLKPTKNKYPPELPISNEG